MKKSLVFIGIGIFICCIKAQDINKQALTLEQKAEKYHQKMAEDDKKFPALKKSREEARLTAYKKAAEKIRKAQWINAVNPPECKYYSTEGICRLLATKISPYPEIAHVNTSLDYKFPKKLAGYTAQYITVFSSQELGYSIRYTDADQMLKVDVYIYDIPLLPLQTEHILVRELQGAAREIMETYRDVRFETPIEKSRFLLKKQMEFLFFLVQFGDAKHRQITGVKNYSVAMIFAKNQKFIKVRMTQIGGSRTALGKSFIQFIETFEKNIILDSVTRKKKFEKFETYPIILP